VWRRRIIAVDPRRKPRTAALSGDAVGRPVGRQSRLNSAQQIVCPKWLGDTIVGAKLSRHLQQIDLAEIAGAGNRDDLGLGMLAADRDDRLDPFCPGITMSMMTSCDPLPAPDLHYPYNV